MHGIKVKDVLNQRLKTIQAMAPAMLISYEVRESDDGEYGIITVTDQDSGQVGNDFIETDKSWKRKNAVYQYNEAAMEGHRVTVIAPDSVFPFVKAIISRDGNSSIVLNSYGKLGITIRA
jgi:hypothetical protein